MDRGTKKAVSMQWVWANTFPATNENVLFYSKKKQITDIPFKKNTMYYVGIGIPKKLNEKS